MPERLMRCAWPASEGSSVPKRLIVDLIDIADMDCGDGGVIALGGEIRPLGVIDPCRQLRNEEIQIRIALAMRMRAHVDGHPVDESRKIGAVVEIEPAQQILVRL